MSNSKHFKCPICEKPLTEQEHEHALKVLIGQNKIAQGHAIQSAIKEAVAKINKQNATILAGKEEEIKKLDKALKDIRKGTSPQLRGLADEVDITLQLQDSFPEDEVVHKGKGGDILHSVFYNQEKIGIIVYECKNTQRLLPSHIEQTFKAKKEREANFGILVTTGMLNSFTGFSYTNNIIIIRPDGLVGLISLLRTHLINLYCANRDDKDGIATEFINYIGSPLFKNTIDDAIQCAINLNDSLLDEIREHKSAWRERYVLIQKLIFDSTLVYKNSRSLISGKRIENKLIEFKPKPLLLNDGNTDNENDLYAMEYKE